MPRPPQDDHEIATDDQLRLLDLLYGELDGDEAEQASRAIDDGGDLAGELEGFRSVRSLFAELPDEEPPQAVSAKLLQAAAAYAPKKPPAAEREGFWAWLLGLFRPIVAYPGLAAVASLVVVVGIAGTLYLAGKGRTTEPTIDRPTSGDMLDKSESRPEKTKAEAPGGPQEGRYADMDEEPMEEDAEESEDQKPAPAKESDKKKGTPTGTTSVERSDRDRGGSGGGDDGDGVKATSESNIFLGGESEPDVANDEAPPPPPAEPAPDTIDVDVPPPEIKSVPKDDESSSARALHDKAKSAARRGDCQATNSYGAQIRSLDSGYYNDVYLRDATVRKCAATQGTQSTK